MNDRIENLKKLGFSDDNIQEMVRKFPNTLKLTPDRINAAIQNLLNLGLTPDQARKFVIDTPSILGMALNTVKLKIVTYRCIFEDKTIEILEKSPRRLIQGAEKAKKRFEYLQAMGLTVMDLEKDIFSSESQFKRKYKINL